MANLRVEVQVDWLPGLSWHPTEMMSAAITGLKGPEPTISALALRPGFRVCWFPGNGLYVVLVDGPRGTTVQSLKAALEAMPGSWHVDYTVYSEDGTTMTSIAVVSN